jgi:hypothetical protein
LNHFTVPVAIVLPSGRYVHCETRRVRRGNDCGTRGTAFGRADARPGRYRVSALAPTPPTRRRGRTPSSRPGAPAQVSRRGAAGPRHPPAARSHAPRGARGRGGGARPGGRPPRPGDGARPRAGACARRPVPARGCAGRSYGPRPRRRRRGPRERDLIRHRQLGHGVGAHEEPVSHRRTGGDDRSEGLATLGTGDEVRRRRAREAQSTAGAAGSGHGTLSRWTPGGPVYGLSAPAPGGRPEFW